LEELRSMPHPPAGVELTLSAVMLIIGRGSKLPWTEITSILHEKTFMDDVMKFDQFAGSSTIKKHALETLKEEYLEDEQFNVEKVSHASSAAGPLCAWVKAQVRLAHSSADMKELTAERLLMEEKVKAQREEYEAALRVVEECVAAVLRLNEELERIHEFWRTHAERDLERGNDQLAQAAVFKNAQAAYDAACVLLTASRTEGSIQQHLNRLSKTAADLEKEARKFELELQDIQDLTKTIERLGTDLAAGKEKVQRDLERKEVLETERDNEFIEQQRLQAELESVVAVLNRDDTRDLRIQKELHDLSAAIKEKEAETQVELDALAVSSGRSRLKKTRSEAALKDLRHKMADNEEGQAEIERQLNQRKALEAHQKEHAVLVARVETVRRE